MSTHASHLTHPTFVMHDLDKQNLAIRRGGVYVRVTRSFLNAQAEDPAQLIRLATTGAHAAPQGKFTTKVTLAQLIRLATTGAHAAPQGKFTTKVTLAQTCIPRAARAAERRETAQILLDLLIAANPGVKLYVKYGTGF